MTTPAMTDLDRERADFEAKARGNGYNLTLTPDGDYAFPAANGAWWAWQTRSALPQQVVAAGIDTAELRKLAMAATPGPWEWWTSNSTLRLTGADGRDGGVLYGYVRAGHGFVNCSPENRTYIAAANPATILRLLDALDARQPAPVKPEGLTSEQSKAVLLAAATCEALNIEGVGPHLRAILAK